MKSGKNRKSFLLALEKSKGLQGGEMSGVSNCNLLYFIVKIFLVESLHGFFSYLGFLT